MSPSRLGLQVNPWVFYPSAALIVAFAIFGVAMPQASNALFTAVQGTIIESFGWFYIAVVGFFLAFVIWLFFSRYSDVRLGPDDSRPEFSFGAWLAMLFSAGMGIGLLFFGVAEPVTHFVNPPVAEPRTIEAARSAVHLTFFHWGLHAWAIYIVVGLCLAYFAYRHNLPLRIRSAFYPLFGDRINGAVGHAIDIFAVFGTMFGVATSLGFGVVQANSGLSHLGLLPVSVTNQLWLIAVVISLTTISVASGLDRGIKLLSQANLLMALVLLVFVFLLGPTAFLMSSFVQSLGYYLQNLIGTTFRTDAFIGTAWQGAWTMFYWGWWISWAPFVGMFIARISRGRTIGQFIVGVLLVPTCLTFMWFVVFGNTALHFELAGTGSGIAEAVQNDMPVALFVLLERLPLATVTSGLAVLLIGTFFVTSADSGALIIDGLTSDPEASGPSPVGQRVFWALTAGALAAALLVAGGLQALQTAVVTMALPFSVIMLVMCYSLVRGLREEAHGLKPASADDGPQALDWRELMATTFAGPRRRRQRRHTQEAVEAFLATTVLPAFETIKAELDTHGTPAEVSATSEVVSLRVLNPAGGDAFVYAVRRVAFQRMPFAFPEVSLKEEGEKLHRAEVVLRSGPTLSDVNGYSQEELIHDFLAEYRKWAGW